MSVSTVPSITPGVTSTAAPIVSAPKALGSADFMKLLAVQFQQQDPMKPMDDTAFIAQMAQFTALSQTQTMTDQMTKLNASQQLAAANSLIGQQVTLDDGNGGTVSGLVSGVQVDATNGPQILVNGNPYLVSAVQLVQPASAATATSSSNTTTPAAAGGS